MDNEVMELIEELYGMVSEAWSVPLGNDKCIVEREKILEILDDIKTALPVELAEAKRLVSARNEFINNAKREAENILKQAQAQAREMVSEDEIYRQAQEEADHMIQAAQDRIRELKEVTNDYVDDALHRTEEAIAEALGQIKDARSKFNALTAPQQPKNSAIIEDVD